VRVSDDDLAAVRELGYAVVPGFVDRAVLTAAQERLWDEFPRPADYFADPEAHGRFARSQFAGLRAFPAKAWAINRLAFVPDLVDAAERFFATTDIEIYKIELWAKYAGAIDYDQPPHRDFGNHSLVVPRTDGMDRQLTTFVLLSDVTIDDAPTMVVPLAHTRDVPMVPDPNPTQWPMSMPPGTFTEVEVPVTGPGGTLLMYRSDVFHRGSAFRSPGRSRFALLADYQRRGASWAGKMAWPNVANHPAFVETMTEATERERELFGFPPPGHDYWNEQTLCDVGRRYPAMDMSPYRQACGAL
jgi:ectoine hydroxylase-related dioxygenase (phytanoyl-CoA dioxygenase family)